MTEVNTASLYLLGWMNIHYSFSKSMPVRVKSSDDITVTTVSLLTELTTVI